MIQILFRATKGPKYACRCCSIKYLLFFFASLTLLFLSFPSQSRAVALQGEWLLGSVPGEDGVSLVERGTHWVLLTQVLHTPDIFQTSKQPIPSHWGSSHPISWCTTLINPVFEYPTPLQSCPLPLLFCIRTIMFFSYVSFPLFIPHLSGKTVMPGINFLPLKTVQSKDLGRCHVSSACRSWGCALLLAAALGNTCHGLSLS